MAMDMQGEEDLNVLPVMELADVLNAMATATYGKEAKMSWKVSDMEIGDNIVVQVVNKKGDRNLDGTILRGTIKELVPSHNMVRLESGWCCHVKDKLLKHRRLT